MSDDVKKEIAVHAVATHLRPLPSPADQLETLFREHHEMVFKTAYRITGTAVDAEDVLQTVFLRLARRGEAIDLAPSPGSYLHRAAVNAALDVARGRTRVRAVPVEEADALRAAGSGPNPESLQADREIHDLVRQSVATLNPKAAEIFVLRYFEGYSNGEIAELLGISKLVVPVLLHRARARVRQDLARSLGRNDETHS